MKRQHGLCLLLDLARLDWFTNSPSWFRLRLAKDFQTSKYFIIKNFMI